MRPTRFAAIDVVDIPVRERWSIDDIVGYLYSTSYASKIILGDRAPAFEHDIRHALHTLNPDGQFEKITEYTAILAPR